MSNKNKENKLNNDMESTTPKYNPFDTDSLERERQNLSREAKEITKPLIDDMNKYRQQLNNEENSSNKKGSTYNTLKR